MMKNKSSRRDALLLIDVINDFDFKGSDRILPKASRAAEKIASLRERAIAADLPVIYINDNFGRWRSDFRQQVEHCLKDQCPGREIAKLLAPGKDDYFVLKPMHSGFYSSTLDVLLKQLGIRRLYMCGFAADLCVLYTANDAYMRGYELVVPADCTASETAARYRFALAHIEEQLKADIRESRKIRFV